MRPTALKLTAGILLFCGLNTTVKAQVEPINVVTTAVPFLRISPDARSGGMGDLGVATSPDAYSGLWNGGKVAFNTGKAGVGATYTPWLKDLVNDVYLATFAGYYKFADNQAIHGSVRYFSLGNITFTDNLGNDFGSYRPREFGIDVGYSRKLNAKNGVGVTLKFINSNLAGNTTVGSTTYKAGNAVAADLSYFHTGIGANGSGWNFGAVLSNLGSKISYTDNADAKDFIPANLGIGTNYTKQMNAQNKISFGVELNKLLVPTPPEDPATPAQLTEYRNKSVIGSWFSSFGDAPGGFGEEIKEFQASLGAEYTYNNQFSLRAGYFYENKTKGNRRYFTAGLGVKYNVFGFNFAYLVPTGSGVSRNPLSNTLRFSVIFDFEK
ncbi:MAG TPA: type IX secretion system outer membrane channel protein PorV [Chitinophagaceae bacterium]|nr:type IX secretion system outer membrane channel protein PorV [Chitinophagaceae bacterium]MBP7107089.1 type IX secretion system outer membrane channel protein PorV [Chitinophagaceae bacterium]MBP7315347.1 type IX secretion system outer membrane channel protein PorV [Chitinophagaceae bacterium]HQV53935.1 type IX secretion system outer membrane channel protein PorV [Chitinophagaceae bacterium]HQX95904.1 type IX secretion system outer membrane channel protein PorV [Chitinophagaceae bacterium]